AKRKRITPEQLEDLVGLFEKTDTPSFEIRESLAKKLGMTNREIQVWFQNRRAKANRIKINEQAALHHQQHLQMQQQQHMQGHHHLSHHRSNSTNGFSSLHPGLIHSAPATPLQPLPGHHHHHHQPGSSAGGSAGQEPSAFGYFGPNGSSSPPMTMPTPTPRAHSQSQHGQPNRRPASLYDMGSYGHHLRSQQFQPQKPSQFHPHQTSSSPSPSAHYGHHTGHNQSGHGHPQGFYEMDIILPTNSSSSLASSSSQRPILPPPISTLQPRRPGQSLEDFNGDSRRPYRHERTMSEGHPAGYMSPTSVSSLSPPPERHMDMQYRDEHEEDSPISATHPSSFINGGSNIGHSGHRHTASLTSFGLKAMGKDREENDAVTTRERAPATAYYNNPAQAAKNRRSYDDSSYDEDQQLMHDNFNMEKRLVISEDEPRPESAIDLLAYAAEMLQKTEEHKTESKEVDPEKREASGPFGQLSSSNKRQSFHGPSGYPSKEPFHEDPSSSSSSSRYSSNSMAWEPSSSAANTNSNPDVMPVPRRRGGDDGPYAPRRPRPVTYGGSGYLYDHHENQFMPQSPSSSLGGTYGRLLSSRDGARRLTNRNSTDVGAGGLLLQRGLTRPRRSSSTTTTGLNSHMSSSSIPVLPPIINENRLLSPVMVESPQFGATRLARQDSQGNGTRESPGSDSYSRDSYNDDMEDVEEEDNEFQRQRAAKRRSGTTNSFFGMAVK
ncbi:hypothetical protein BX616_005395, partial [Lobosporangium transversale]